MKHVLLILVMMGIFLPAVAWADKRNTASLRSPEWYLFWEQERELQPQQRLRQEQRREQSREDKTVMQEQVRTRQREQMQRMRFGRE